MKRSTLFPWVLIFLGFLYFFVPLIGTLDFSLRLVKDQITLEAYKNVVTSARFQNTFTYSFIMALWTILAGTLLITPTAYWVHLKLPQLRPIIEFVTLLTYVVPAIILVFGIIRVYSRPPLSILESELGSDFLLVMGYVAMSLPAIYRSVDTGLRAIDVRTLTEAAQSLGAGWRTILLDVIFPNLRIALLSGAFITFAMVIGEFTIATFLARPAFGPYMANLGQTRPYESTALTIISLGLTWACIGMMQLLGRSAQGQIAGTR